MAFDSKEYTRLRDIVVKRNKRAVAAGLAAPIHFPTVREIKSGYVDPGQAMRAVKGFHSGGSTVKAIRQTGLAPVMPSFPVAPPERKLSDEEKRQQKRERDRLYRQRRRIRQNALTPEKAAKYGSYLKTLDTVTKTWAAKGFDLGISLSSLTPEQAQAFVEYMDYRFSQGDFQQRYVVDEFIQDFSKLMQSGYKPGQITSDFEKFLENRGLLQGRADAMEGVSGADSISLWHEFADRGLQ